MKLCEVLGVGYFLQETLSVVIDWVLFVSLWGWGHIEIPPA